LFPHWYSPSAKESTQDHGRAPSVDTRGHRKSPSLEDLNLSSGPLSSDHFGVLTSLVVVCARRRPTAQRSTIDYRTKPYRPDGASLSQGVGLGQEKNYRFLRFLLFPQPGQDYGQVAMLLPNVPLEWADAEHRSAQRPKGLTYRSRTPWALNV